MLGFSGAYDEGRVQLLRSLEPFFKEHGDSFVMKGEMKEKGTDERYCVVLTDRSYFRVENENNLPKRRKDLSQLHSVIEDPTDPLAFFIFSYVKVLQNKTAKAIDNFRLKTSGGQMLDFEASLKKKHLVCSSADERDQWIILFNQCIRDRWQRILELEAEIVRSPEVYQAHYCIFKINRQSQAQDRVLVLSDSWIYNLEPVRDELAAEISSKGMKWAYPVSSVKVVRLTRCKDNIDIGPAVTVYFDTTAIKKSLKEDGNKHVGSKGEKTNDTHTFAFHSEDERSAFVTELARLYMTAFTKEPSKDTARLAVDAVEDMAVADVVRARSVTKQEAPKGEGEARIAAFLEKFTQGGKGSHMKWVSVLPSGLIEWRDHMPTESKTGKTDEARIISVQTDVHDLKHKKALSEDERGRIFTVQTTGKTLVFLAPSGAERGRWVSAIEVVLGKRPA